MLFYVLDDVLLWFCLLIVIFPLLNVVSQSLSTPEAVINGQVLFWPIGFNLDAYKRVLGSPMIMTGLLNTVFYAFFGTLINVFLTVTCAYPLSRKDFVGRGVFIGIFFFTMIFSGGMIPAYLNLRNLHILNTRWAMLLPGAMSVSNMIIARTYFATTIPVELYDAAEVDGASDFMVIRKIVVPLSVPIIAVQCLFYAVAHWNAFFNGMLYLNDPKLFNLQLVLRNIISNINLLNEKNESMTEAAKAAAFSEVLRYAVLVFASLPIMLVYPFVQKYFIKGIMVGTLKG